MYYEGQGRGRLEGGWREREGGGRGTVEGEGRVERGGRYLGRAMELWRKGAAEAGSRLTARKRRRLCATPQPRASLPFPQVSLA